MTASQKKKRAHYSTRPDWNPSPAQVEKAYAAKAERMAKALLGGADDLYWQYAKEGTRVQPAQYGYAPITRVVIACTCCGHLVLKEVGTWTCWPCRVINASERHRK